MRTLTLASILVSAFSVVALTTAARAADFQEPGYGAAPLPAYGPPPPVYGPPPQAYGYAPAYPPVAVVPGAAYDDQAIIIEGERYYRDCWWDWGRRRCELKRYW